MINNDDFLKKYVCLNPFRHLEFFEKHIFCCCPGWLNNTHVGDVNNLDKIWGGENIKKIQDSVLDGTYSYCDKNLCPGLSDLYYKHKIGGGFIKKTEFVRDNYNDGPKILNFSIDRSCNLSCPSCRTHLIMANSNELVRNNKIMDDVTTFFGKSVNTLCMIGSGDVFASKTFRNFLINFDSEKFPNVNSISIQTNGLLLNEDMWNKIIKSRDLIKMINISIDASTKKTYETVRRGGNWDILMNNLKFISKLNSKITFSFIVQDTNYMEMESAYELINKLSPTFEITYTKITNWGTFSEEEFKVKEIYNENHINFNLFLNELNKVIFKTNVFSNMNDIVKKYLT